MQKRMVVLPGQRASKWPLRAVIEVIEPASYPDEWSFKPGTYRLACGHIKTPAMTPYDPKRCKCKECFEGAASCE